MKLADEEHFRPITKNINIDQWLLLARIAAKNRSVDDFNKEAVQALPQATRKTRQEWVGRFRSTFLSIQDDKIENTPALWIWGSENADLKLKRELLYIYYLCHFPLVWRAARDLLLPRAQPNQADDAATEIPLEIWDSFLRANLVSCADSTFVRTRNHLTAVFQKFGLLESEKVNGEHLEKRFIVNPVQPSLEAILFSLGLEYQDQGWTSRTYDFLVEESWTRVGLVCPENYLHWALDQAVALDLGYSDYFGSEKQFTWRVDDVPAAVADIATA